MATTLCLASPMTKGTPLPGNVNSPEMTEVSVENNTDCLLVAVTVMKLEFKKDGTLKEMILYFGEWIEPGQKAKLYVKEGEYYAMLVESFFWDPDTKKATQRAGEEYREGKYDPNAPSAKKIDIRCWHTQLREA